MGILLPEATRAGDYTDSVRARLQAGTQTPAVANIAAKETRERLREKIRAIQRDIDLFVLPTTPMLAPLLDEPAAAPPGADGLKRRIRRTAPFNLLGQPALSLPCGFTETRYPIGLQIVRRDFEDGLVLRGRPRVSAPDELASPAPAGLGQGVSCGASTNRLGRPVRSCTAKP